ncbi:MAG TPA: hypothetical protein VKP65_08750 [Rhodothermales bacterium]|nr:hypothetical protein [Rhodothermales bacterium]
METRLVSEENLHALIQEADEILAMTVASIKTMRRRNGKQPIQNPQSKI